MKSYGCQSFSGGKSTFNHIISHFLLAVICIKGGDSRQKYKNKFATMGHIPLKRRGLRPS